TQNPTKTSPSKASTSGIAQWGDSNVAHADVVGSYLGDVVQAGVPSSALPCAAPPHSPPSIERPPNSTRKSSRCECHSATPLYALGRVAGAFLGPFRKFARPKR